MTEKVLKDLNKTGKLFVIPATIQDKFIIRFTVTSQFTTREDILRDWTLIQQAAVQVFNLHHTAQAVVSEEGVQRLGTITSLSPISVNAASQCFPENGDCKMSPKKVMVQPRRRSLSSAVWLYREHVPVLEDPHLDDCFTEDGPDSSTHKLSSFLSLSVRAKKKTVRSLSMPTADLREPSYPKAGSLECSGNSGPCTTEKLLSKLPKEVLRFKKNLKFYSIPNFPECSIQCGLQLPCCPLQAIV